MLAEMSGNGALRTIIDLWVHCTSVEHLFTSTYSFTLTMDYSISRLNSILKFDPSTSIADTRVSDGLAGTALLVTDPLDTWMNLLAFFKSRQRT